MPTKTKKLWLKAKAEAKASKVFNDDQLARLQQGAYRVYGCACAWCQYREYRVIARKPDPGPGTGFGEAPAECKEPQTVKFRTSVNASAPPLSLFTK